MIKMFHAKCCSAGFTKDKFYKVNDLGYGVSIIVDDNGEERMIPSHFLVEQTIFTHPKWVTVKDDSLGSVTKDKDYKVLDYWSNNYKILDDNGIECSLNKERFYKVTPKDLLPPKKKSVEHIDEGFEGLFVDARVYKEGNYIDKTEFTTDQLNYMQELLPSYSDRTFTDHFKYVVFSGGDFLTVDRAFMGSCKITFNDIFKYAEEK